MWEKLFSRETHFIFHYLKRYRRLLALGLLSLIVVDILEVIPPILLKFSVDSIMESKPMSELLKFSLAYLGISFLQAVCRYGWRYFWMRADLYSGRDLRKDYARHVFGLSASFFDRKKVGELMSLATNDTEAVRRAIGPGMFLFADALFYFLTIPVVMLFLSPQLTLLAFIPFPLIPYMVIRNKRAVHERFEKVQESFGRLSAQAQENISGIRLVKAFARDAVQVERFRRSSREYLGLTLSLERIQTVLWPSLDFIMSLGLVLLLFYGGHYVIEDAVTLGTFVAFQRYIQKMIWPMAAVGLFVTFFQRARASAGRIMGVLAETTDIRESSRERQRMPEGFRPGGAWKTPGRIQVRNLSFTFVSEKGSSLQDVSLEIEHGERVAFVGGVGSGKSTLLSLLPRLYPAPDASLFIDDVDINAWPLRELRNQFGFVTQDVFLFSESVLENVAFGMLQDIGETEKMDAVKQAAEMVSIHPEIRRMQDGYGTYLGERGINVSGGQKQRLSIARAILKQPAILILDDALSSVDVETEKAILQALRNRAGRNTELIAAHRISTIRHADRIFVLERGRLVQQGTHKELVREKGGTYWGFYEQQRLKEELESYVEKIKKQF